MSYSRDLAEQIMLAAGYSADTANRVAAMGEIIHQIELRVEQEKQA